MEIKMTPCQKIKRDILLICVGCIKQDIGYADKKEKNLVKSIEAGITAENVDKLYNILVEMDYNQDCESEFREGEVETKLPTCYSRHYECKEVARKLSDGTWVGWTYYYGGGKHGEPEAVQWMENAYNLELTEKEMVVKVQEFKKI
jgi:hypothetical protein